MGRGELSGEFTACRDMADGSASFNKHAGRFKDEISFVRDATDRRSEGTF